METAVVTLKELYSLKRWDAPRVIECKKRGGDIVSSSKYINAGRGKKQYGLLDLIDKAKDF